MDGDEVTSPRMERLAIKVAETIYEGDWEAEVVTREIATAVGKAEALKRLETLKDEVEQAIEIVKKAR